MNSNEFYSFEFSSVKICAALGQVRQVEEREPRSLEIEFDSYFLLNL